MTVIVMMMLMMMTTMMTIDPTLPASTLMHVLKKLGFVGVEAKLEDPEKNPQTKKP